MLKVIIADDEEKICQLIVKLIDWDGLEMQVLAVVLNGADALDAIRLHNPDIVITDIRMPGIDGLQLVKSAKEEGFHTQFIIISGYRHFEYAQKAIRYGVGDYLLKPIKKTELTQTLQKLKRILYEKDDLISAQEKIGEVIKNNTRRQRTTYLAALVNASSQEMPVLLMEDANRQYFYHFHSDMFQFAIIKLDRVLLDAENAYFFANKVELLTQEFLSKLCHEQEFYIQRGFIYLLLNFPAREQRQIRKQLKLLLGELMVQESIFKNMCVSIGLGNAVDNFAEIDDSRKSALFRIEQRLLVGCGKLIEDGDVLAQSLARGDFCADIHEEIMRAIESFDPVELEGALDRILKAAPSRSDYSGHVLLQIVLEIGNAFFSAMRRNALSLENESTFLKEFEIRAMDFYDTEELHLLMNISLVLPFQRATQNRIQECERPTRLAKQFIQENFRQPISLEDVSLVAGLSPTYFCSLFKKETGMSFLEYVSEARIAEAKRLLRKTNRNVSDICEEVGYKDVKYFTKSFIKHTGLKPNEFRKIYS